MPLSCRCDTMTSAAATSSFSPGFHHQPRPGRRLPPIHGRQPAGWAVLLAVFVCLISHAVAAAAHPQAPVETLIIDRRSPVWDGERWLMLSEHELERRRMHGRAATESSTSSASSESSTTSAPASVTTTFSVAVGSPQTTSSSTTVSASPLPSILDSMSNNFAPGPNGAPAPCPIFIKSFLGDPTFKQCYPLSMLFDSKSFFEAQRSLVGITRTLDATCAANATFCSQYLAQLAQKLIEDDNCGADYKSGQTTVVDAYNEMTAYAPVYSAGCLKDPNTGAYCYANAVTNQTNPSSGYFYFLPLNQSLPGATVPACNDCLKQTMAIYQAATADRRQLIVNTYVAAAKQVNTVCGPGFVNESLAAEVIPSAAVPSRSSTWLAAALPLLVATLWLV